MSEAKKGRNNPFYGKPRSKATKRKISKAMNARRNHYSEDRYTELSRVLCRENELVLRRNI